MSGVGTKNQFCTFRIGERLFGINLLSVKEIGRQIGCTPVPHAPLGVRGYLNLRGQIWLVVDPRPLFGIQATEDNHDTSIVFFKNEVALHMGMLVDKVESVVEVGADQIEERRKRSADEEDSKGKRTIPPAVTAGICRLPKSLMVVLDARSIPKLVDRSSGSSV